MTDVAERVKTYRQSEIAQDEVFGLVVTVQRFSDEDYTVVKHVMLKI